MVWIVWVLHELTTGQAGHGRGHFLGKDDSCDSTFHYLSIVAGGQRTLSDSSGGVGDPAHQDGDVVHHVPHREDEGSVHHDCQVEVGGTNFKKTFCKQQHKIWKKEMFKNNCLLRYPEISTRTSYSTSLYSVQLVATKIIKKVLEFLQTQPFVHIRVHSKLG